MNVYPENELITKLDDFIARSNGMVEYKTSIGLNKWNNRHDPITIYFHRPINKTDEAEIIKLAKAHIRSDNNMLGRKISDGIYQVFEPTEKDVLALINRAEKMKADPELIEWLKSTEYLSANLYQINSKGQKIVRTSPGLLEAAKRLLDDMEKLI